MGWAQSTTAWARIYDDSRITNAVSQSIPNDKRETCYFVKEMKLLRLSTTPNQCVLQLPNFCCLAGYLFSSMS